MFSIEHPWPYCSSTIMISFPPLTTSSSPNPPMSQVGFSGKGTGVIYQGPRKTLILDPLAMNTFPSLADSHGGNATLTQTLGPMHLPWKPHKNHAVGIGFGMYEFVLDTVFPLPVAKRSKGHPDLSVGPSYLRKSSVRTRKKILSLLT
jgi:hypothetical protein